MPRRILPSAAERRLRLRGKDAVQQLGVAHHGELAAARCHGRPNVWLRSAEQTAAGKRGAGRAAGPCCRYSPPIFIDRSSPADSLIKVLPRLLGPYQKYCSDIPEALKLLETKQNNKAFLRFEAGFGSMNKPTMNFIMRPVQRVMKYVAFCVLPEPGWTDSCCFVSFAGIGSPAPLLHGGCLLRCVRNR